MSLMIIIETFGSCGAKADYSDFKNDRRKKNLRQEYTVVSMNFSYEAVALKETAVMNA